MSEGFDSGGGGFDSFSETTSTSWFQRIGRAIAGVFVGLILFVVAFPLLFWNEGRAITTHRALQEGSHAVVEVPAERVDPSHEKELVHVTGMATTKDLVRDADFGVAVQALRLRRESQIYHWRQRESEETHRRIGGSEEKKTTYTYEKVWSEQAIDSHKFKAPPGHENTGSLEFATETRLADKITLGGFTLPKLLAEQISSFQPVSPADIHLEQGSPRVREHWKAAGEWFYRGNDPENPQIGDQRLKFSQVPATEVSLYAQQSGDTFAEYVAHNGRSLSRLELGRHSAQEMFQHAEATNNMITWLVRVGGFLLMAIGMYSMARPVVVFADVLPFLGSLAGLGVGLFATFISAALSLITIAIGWVFYRPLIGGAILAAAIAILATYFYLGRKRGADNAAASPS